METLFEKMFKSNIVPEYPNLVSYIETLYNYRESWPLSCTSDMRIRGNNTNNTKIENKSDGSGLQIPKQAAMEKIFTRVTTLDDNLFVIPTISEN